MAAVVEHVGTTEFHTSLNKDNMCYGSHCDNGNENTQSDSDDTDTEIVCLEDPLVFLQTKYLSAKSRMSILTSLYFIHQSLLATATRSDTSSILVAITVEDKYTLPIMTMECIKTLLISFPYTNEEKQIFKDATSVYFKDRLSEVALLSLCAVLEGELVGSHVLTETFTGNAGYIRIIVLNKEVFSRYCSFGIGFFQEHPEEFAIFFSEVCRMKKTKHVTVSVLDDAISSLSKHRCIHDKKKAFFSCINEYLYTKMVLKKNPVKTSSENLAKTWDLLPVEERDELLPGRFFKLLDACRFPPWLQEIGSAMKRLSYLPFEPERFSGEEIARDIECVLEGMHIYSLRDNGPPCGNSTMMGRYVEGRHKILQPGLILEPMVTLVRQFCDKLVAQDYQRRDLESAKAAEDLLQEMSLSSSSSSSVNNNNKKKKKKKKKTKKRPPVPLGNKDEVSENKYGEEKVSEDKYGEEKDEVSEDEHGEDGWTAVGFNKKVYQEGGVVVSVVAEEAQVVEDPAHQEEEIEEEEEEEIEEEEEKEEEEEIEEEIQSSVSSSVLPQEEEEEEEAIQSNASGVLYHQQQQEHVFHPEASQYGEEIPAYFHYPPCLINHAYIVCPNPTCMATFHANAPEAMLHTAYGTLLVCPCCHLHFC
jgi:hypothetical protein